MRHYIRISELSDPSLVYELLSNACHLVQTNICDLKLDIGSHVIINKQVIPISDPNGIKLYNESIPDIKITINSLDITESNGIKYFNLTDMDGYQIMKSLIGLLPTDYVPYNGEITEFWIDGISIYDLSEIRIFGVDFEFSGVDPESIVLLLNDLEVPRPKISEITKTRLKGLISNDWEVKGLNEYYEDDEGSTTEEKIKSDDDFLTLRVTNEELNQIVKPENDDITDMLIDFDMDIGLVQNLPMVTAKFRPQRILDRVLYCKYNFIARACMDPIYLSKTSIKLVYKNTGNKFLVYSLIYLYDKLYHNLESPSPKIMKLNVRESFIKKFSLFEDEYEID